MYSARLTSPTYLTVVWRENIARPSPSPPLPPGHLSPTFVSPLSPALAQLDLFPPLNYQPSPAHHPFSSPSVPLPSPRLSAHPPCFGPSGPLPSPRLPAHPPCFGPSGPLPSPRLPAHPPCPGPFGLLPSPRLPAQPIVPALVHLDSYPPFGPLSILPGLSEFPQP
ncbi:hypothetical protein PoB_007161200 [Plakobranchus ocellatus]|uniref:Uncharacterized protein n=1 Tax=Plakobranchus ocellatus TaxID=259542 RepID=A0AAV4DLF3_9GAST|nr:hypothetical protein PoB_007161200 [Plakobranchus ocellatus]